MTDQLDHPAVVAVPVLLSVARVGELLDCSPRTVRRRIASRELPAVIEHGRVMVRADELRAYIDGLERIGAGRTVRRRPRDMDRFAWLR